MSARHSPPFRAKHLAIFSLPPTEGVYISSVISRAAVSLERLRFEQADSEMILGHGDCIAERPAHVVCNLVGPKTRAKKARSERLHHVSIGNTQIFSAEPWHATYWICMI